MTLFVYYLPSMNWIYNILTSLIEIIKKRQSLMDLASYIMILSIDFVAF